MQRRVLVLLLLFLPISLAVWSLSRVADTDDSVVMTDNDDQEPDEAPAPRQSGASSVDGEAEELGQLAGMQRPGVVYADSAASQPSSAKASSAPAKGTGGRGTGGSGRCGQGGAPSWDVGVSQAATATGSVVNVYDGPDGAIREAFASPARTQFGQVQPATFWVMETRGEWLHVLLNRRPNGADGWIHSSEVSLTPMPYHIEISLSSKQLVVYEGSEPILADCVGVGKGSTPTPTGQYFVAETWDLRGKGTVFGNFALALSAYSNVYEQFMGGNGQIAIHGTSNSANRGKAVSNGCIRVYNPVVGEVARIVPRGTPVIITS